RSAPTPRQPPLRLSCSLLRSYPPPPLSSAHARAPPELYPLSLHDALPISVSAQQGGGVFSKTPYSAAKAGVLGLTRTPAFAAERSEEHTSELQSRFDLVCRLLLEKKKAEVEDTRDPHRRKARRQGRQQTRS